jgi:hypothetical protein
MANYRIITHKYFNRIMQKMDKLILRALLLFCIFAMAGCTGGLSDGLGHALRH